MVRLEKAWLLCEQLFIALWDGVALSDLAKRITTTRTFAKK